MLYSKCDQRKLQQYHRACNQIKNRHLRNRPTHYVGYFPMGQIRTRGVTSDRVSIALYIETAEYTLHLHLHYDYIRADPPVMHWACQTCECFLRRHAQRQHMQGNTCNKQQQVFMAQRVFEVTRTQYKTY